jgi:hypothetical protein
VLVPRRIAFALALTLVAPLSAGAQSPAARTPVGCTYETCALRVEPRFWGPARLLRGREGVEVGKLGGFGGGVDTLLAGPDSAAAHAREYVTAARRSNTLGLLGGVAYVALLFHSDSFDDVDNTDIALGITALGFSIASIPFELHAKRSLARAVWFYNAALAR